MSNLKVSILGCGWLGKPLGTALVNRGCLVLGSTTKSENISILEAAGVVPYVFDVNRLRSGDVPHEFFECDVLVISLPHGARRGKSDEYVSQINDVVNAARHGTKNIILISTTSVYPNLNRIVTEQCHRAGRRTCSQIRNIKYHSPLCRIIWTWTASRKVSGGEERC
jgi:nucleoside-diphosphate-sugar epimerase